VASTALQSRSQRRKVRSASKVLYFASAAVPLLQLAIEAAACARIGMVRTKQFFASEKLVKNSARGIIAEMLP
jgi:hypothetical protein